MYRSRANKSINEETTSKYHEIKKYQFIQSTSDGINCHQVVKFDDQKFKEIQLSCPPKYDQETSVWMSAGNNNSGNTPLNGQIKNFMFFTHDLEN